MPKSPQN
ncbi:hypothetical protein F383_16369 [Gossypium arboreum]|nr:hypothetical protein F383_36874 [Gossypium arboreum]KHF99824.1 hypothetical protein F383_38597 [Gossypium arboreum]KHG10531.1 hypothetical protein F383_16369 [Gossypium arboreum]